MLHYAILQHFVKLNGKIFLFLLSPFNAVTLHILNILIAVGLGSKDIINILSKPIAQNSVSGKNVQMIVQST